MSNRLLVEQFNAWRTEGLSLALGTVIETAGSTYSKAGRQILIAADGRHAGLVSGGCLEGDLAEHARQVIATGAADVVTYDMREAADDIWGIGLGCNGMMRILLQRLDERNNWQPFSGLAAAMQKNKAVFVALLVQSGNSELPVGHCRLIEPSGTPEPSAPEWLHLPSSLPALIDARGIDAKVLCWELTPWPRLLVLGAGPDALPLVNLARTLGWETTLADHRPHYLQAGAFAGADRRVLVEPPELGTQLQLADYTAVVVMSHHLDTDRTYLGTLAAYENLYIGVLGPAARRARLLDELGLSESPFAGRLRGPVGVDIGADSPETIALSIVTEIQTVMRRSSGSAARH
jgi:xanthine/CO dehydrogenase XdhC/CoxF family maturation factor